MAQRHNYTPCISKHQTNQEMILNSIAIVFPTRFVAVFLFALCVLFFLMFFDIFWFYYNCILSVLWPMSISDHKVVTYQRSWEKIFKTGGYFFWRLEMKNLLMEPRETIPKTGNVWKRGGTWNIAIDHAFQNTKRIKKWYSTVLLLYFLRVLLLPSDLHFAFYVFGCFLTFSDCVTIVFCFFLANVHFCQKKCQYQSTVWRKSFNQKKCWYFFWRFKTGLVASTWCFFSSSKPTVKICLFFVLVCPCAYILIIFNYFDRLKLPRTTILGGYVHTFFPTWNVYSGGGHLENREKCMPWIPQEWKWKLGKMYEAEGGGGGPPFIHF